MQAKEAKLNKKLSRIDSTKAKELFGQSTQLYAGLQNRLTTGSGKLQKLSNYVPQLDSLQTATKFLQQAGGKLSDFSPDKLQQLNQLNSSLQGVQQRLESATEIRQLLSERQQQLQQALVSYGLGKQLTGLKTEMNDYQQQLNEYKDMLHDQQKLEQKVLSVVSGTAVFKDFMSGNSQLAQLFPMPASNGTAQALVGLQTQSSVQQLLQTQLGGNATSAASQAGQSAAAQAGQSGSSGAAGYLQQQVQAAQDQLDQLKNKANQLGGGSGTIDMPDGTPTNTQHTRSFLKRIELGFNIQSQKTNYLLPATSDIALTVGYKLSKISTVGVGFSYKIGYGSSLSDISLSNQGLSVRSYGEIKLKGKADLWVTAGYEQNWLPQLATILDSANVHVSGWGLGWQESGLIGLTKKYKIGKKTGNFQLLWDFLSYSQIPRGTALKFRIGYTF
jgi:myosin heavy subunit